MGLKCRLTWEIVAHGGVRVLRGYSRLLGVRLVLVTPGEGFLGIDHIIPVTHAVVVSEDGWREKKGCGVIAGPGARNQISVVRPSELQNADCHRINVTKGLCAGRAA